MLNFLTILGFGFGVTLTVILLSLSLKKSPKHYDDFAFGVLLVCCALWYGGNFLSLLSRMLFGSVVILSVHFFRIVGYLGLAALPSALVHVYLAMWYHTSSHENPVLSRSQLLNLLLCYVPFVVFVILGFSSLLSNKGSPASLSLAFILWILFTIIISVTVSEKLVRKFAEHSDRQFYRDISYLLAGIGMGLIFVYIIPVYRVAYVGRYLHLIMMLSSTLPLAVIAFHIYRYNFYRLVIKPSLVYSIIYGLVMAIYVLGIRNLGMYLNQFPEVNSAFIEGLLLVILIFVFQPFRVRFQRWLDKIFFKDRFYYQQFLHNFSNSIKGMVDLEKLLYSISQALAPALKTKACTIVVFFDQFELSKTYKVFGNQEFVDLNDLINALHDTHDLQLRQQLYHQRVIKALKANHLALAVPIYYHHVLIGLLCLQEKQNGAEYTDEEIDILQSFSDQVALAVENARLVQDRLNLEAKYYQSEKLNSLGQLAATIAHEIKNPLSSIKSIIQVLHESTGEVYSRDLDFVVSEINRLNAVLENLLIFAKPGPATLEKVDLVTAVNDTIMLLTHQAIRSGVEIQFQPLQDNMQVLATKQSLREIIFNLVFNAIQAMPEGGQIRIELEKYLKPVLKYRKIRHIQHNSIVNWIDMKVIDTGPGIPKEIQTKIFDPFFTTKTKGTGLGLAIVKRNVLELGGLINLRSKTGSGSTFQVLLPVYDERKARA